MVNGQPRGFGAFGFRLQFEAEGFVYGGTRHPYDTVRHVDYKQHTFVMARQQQTVRMYDARLRVTLVNGRRLNIYADAKLGRNQRTQDKNVQASMEAAAEWLQTYTFNARMDAYEADFAARRYLRWGKYQITPNGELYRRHAFCMNLHDSRARCLLYDFHLTCVLRPTVWWRRLLYGFIQSTETLDLKRDRDCFLYMMREHLRIHWPDETLRLYRGRAAGGEKEPPQAQPEAPFEAPPFEAPRQESDKRQEPPRQEEQRREAPPPPPRSQPMPSFPQHLATLGLGPDVTWEVVRSSYRKLAREHHPDLVRGRGASEKDVKIAEEKLKAINEAYGWLEDFYKLKPK